LAAMSCIRTIIGICVLSAKPKLVRTREKLVWRRHYKVTGFKLFALDSYE
jgi:hypothetical protein